VSNRHERQTTRVPVLARLGDLMFRRRKATIAGTLVAVLALAALAAGAMASLVLSRWEAPGTESVRAQEVLAAEFGTGNSNLILLVTAAGSDVDDPAVAAAAQEVSARLAAEPAVGDVWSYWSLDRDPTLRSADGDSAIVLAHVLGDATSARAEIAELIPAYTASSPVIDVAVAGSEAASTQISRLATQDFLRAEMIIVPLMLVLLVLVYRRVSSALLTLAVGLFSVLATLAGLRVLATLTEVSSFAANITLVMGVGLGVDYSLFVISRFREALGRGSSVRDAIVETLDTAGRTVVFSGLTVAASLAVLLALPFPFLQSFGYAGILVVVTAVVGALVVLPAALAMVGQRAVRRGLTPPAAVDLERGGWFRVGKAVMRRPVLSGGLALAMVLALAAPALGLRIGLPDDRVLPADSSVRQTYEVLRADFPVEANDAIHVVAPVTEGADPAAVVGYAAALSQVEGIAQVNSAVGSFTGGQLTRAPGASAERLTGDTGTRLEAIPTREALAGTDTDRLVAGLRAVPSPVGEVLIGGYPAELTDFRATLMERIPLVAALILLVTFVILFLMSGSLLIPLKATVLNLLSIGVMFGVLVAVFQNGAFADLLGFTPIGTLDPAFPILMFCVAYGLSMDYEVFMLSRIKEEYDRTGDNDRSVLLGMQRSAPLITAAALTLAVSFGVYATGQIMYLKMIGIGTAIAIAVDATLIRAVLVPAFMRLAGDANWWAPAPLRRVYERFGIRESAEPPQAPGRRVDVPVR